MSSPTDDDAGTVAEPGPDPDPALSYPRGNRLGIGHPRPTVVVLVALVLLVGGAYAWRRLQPPQARFCTVTGTSGPVRGEPEEAFQAWWDEGGAAGAARTASHELGQPVDPPTFDDFHRNGDDWEWVFAEHRLVLVSTRSDAAGADGWLVGGVNTCQFDTAAELGVSTP